MDGLSEVIPFQDFYVTFCDSEDVEVVGCGV
jgi:hypothetical protein